VKSNLIFWGFIGRKNAIAVFICSKCGNIIKTRKWKIKGQEVVIVAKI
jgi:hypothetical protein